jgi:hypothetical protein
MEENKEPFKDVKTRFLNLILDNGVSLSITVAFCFALYYILHEHNKLLLEQLYKVIEDKRQLTERLLECYKYQKND